MARPKAPEGREKLVVIIDEDASRLLKVIVQLTKIPKPVVVSEAIKLYAQENYEKLKREKENRESLFEF